MLESNNNKFAKLRKTITGGCSPTSKLKKSKYQLSTQQVNMGTKPIALSDN